MPQIDSVNYDQAAGEYAVHRRIHSGVLQELCERGQLETSSRVLEVGCGTGNYAKAVTARVGCAVYGLDPSAGMLAQARVQPDGFSWLLGYAERLPLGSDTFDLIFAVDVIHHLADRAGFYQEAIRALRPGGQVCTVTDSEEIIRRREILSGYFPETVQIELARYPRLAQLEAWMAETGLAPFRVVTVERSYGLHSAQPFRDRAYSSLHVIPEEAWRAGMERLEHDLAQGPIRGASRYACVWGRKSGK
jgi:ubiquinone/menaquinone biosynthesis C-methylase UbiE